MKAIALLVVLLALRLPTFGQDHAKMDVKWSVLSNEDSFITIAMKVRANVDGQYLKDANFVFDYDTTQLMFGKDDGPCVKDTDYFWASGFEPNDSIYNTVTRPRDILVSINIHFETLNGAAITTDTSYTHIIDLKFKKRPHCRRAEIRWQMEKNGKAFENVFDRNYNPYDPGQGWDEPFIVRLE